MCLIFSFKCLALVACAQSFSDTLGDRPRRPFENVRFAFCRTVVESLACQWVSDRAFESSHVPITELFKILEGVIAAHFSSHAEWLRTT